MKPAKIMIDIEAGNARRTLVRKRRCRLVKIGNVRKKIRLAKRAVGSISHLLHREKRDKIPPNMYPTTSPKVSIPAASCDPGEPSPSWGRPKAK